MSLELKKFLSQYVDIPGALMDEVVSRFKPQAIARNEYLLKEGKVCKDFVFVQSGCMRMFYYNDETDVSVWFAFPGSSAIEVTSFIGGTPSEYSIQAIEDSMVLSLSKVELDRLYEVHPTFHQMMRTFWEDVLMNLIQRFTALQKETAEKRYIDLMTNTDYVQKIPQKYLASYLGVTPTSLSRIRRNIK